MMGSECSARASTGRGRPKPEKLRGESGGGAAWSRVALKREKSGTGIEGKFNSGRAGAVVEGSEAVEVIAIVGVVEYESEKELGGFEERGPGLLVGAREVGEAETEVDDLRALRRMRSGAGRSGLDGGGGFAVVEEVVICRQPMSPRRLDEEE